MHRLLLALLVGIVGNVHAQTYVTASYGGQQLNLVIPRGYCVIDRKDEIGKLHYKLQEEGNAGRNAVQVLFSDCKEWAKRQGDPSYILKRHGSYLFQLTGGEELLLPVSLDYAEFIKIYTDDELKRSAGKGLNLTKVLEDKISRATVDAPALNSQVNYGLIDTSDKAVFLGIGATLQYPEELVRVTGVVAATLVKRVPLTINLYDSTKGKTAPFKSLLTQQKDLVSKLLAANN